VRYWGVTLGGTYIDKRTWFVSIIPTLAIEREDDMLALHFSLFNFTLTLMTGVADGEG
jgi:hypothetical protein